MPEQRRGEVGLRMGALMLPVGHRQHREGGSTPSREALVSALRSCDRVRPTPSAAAPGRHQKLCFAATSRRYRSQPRLAPWRCAPTGSPYVYLAVQICPRPRRIAHALI